MDLMLKMVFRQNSLYFASLMMFIDGLYLYNDFRTQFLSFYYFYCYCFCLLVFLLLFLVLLFCWCFYYYYYIFIKFFLILCGYVRYYFVSLLNCPIIFVHDTCVPFYAIFNICNFSIVFFIALS